MKDLPDNPYQPSVLDEFEGKGYAYQTRKLWIKRLSGVFIHEGDRDQLTQLLRREASDFTGPIYRGEKPSVETIQVRVISVRQLNQNNSVRFQGIV